MIDFPNTPWTKIGELASSDEMTRGQIIREFHELYSKPVYAFVRAHFGPKEAIERTAAAMAVITSEPFLLRVGRGEGKLRSYLLGAVKFAVYGYLRKGKVEQNSVSLDSEAMEAYAENMAWPSDLDPAEWLDTMIARDVLKRSCERLRLEFAERGKANFSTLLNLSVNDGFRTAEDRKLAVERLSLSEASARVAIHRFRKQFRQAFAKEVGMMVSDPSDLEEEVEYMLQLLKRRGTL